MKVERLVLDTNVLISALLSPNGKPHACVQWALDHAILLASGDLLVELQTRLARPKFAKYASAATRKAYVDELAFSTQNVLLTGSIKACRDPDDDKILEIAVAGIADCIVSGDKDLLVLDPFRGIPILTPAAFLTTVGVAP